jgi:hypothetical protein
VRRLSEELGLKITEASIRRFFKRHQISYKKRCTPASRRGPRWPEVAEARERWKAGQASLDPKTLVFVEETGTNTKLVRAYGRCPMGQRLLGKQPFGHWKTTTFTAGLRCAAITAPWVLDGAMNRQAFLVYIDKVLAPTLSKGDSVVMDNLPARKGRGRQGGDRSDRRQAHAAPALLPDLLP